MQHRNILISIIVFLLAVAGGVFVLLQQDSQPQLAKESLVAGVAIEEEQQTKQEDTNGSREEQKEAKQDTQAIKSEQSSPKEQKEPVKTSVAEEAESNESQAFVFEPTPEPSPPAPAPAQKPAGKININTAGLEELDQISEVGPAIAQRIIDYRTNISLFYGIEDIKNVSGIGQATFEKMKDEITVGNVGPAPQSSPPPPASAPTPGPTPTPTPSPSPTPTPTPTPPSSSNKININTANHEELQEITGVGPSIAQNIIDYREVNGLFTQIEDIMNVPLIAEGRFEKMKDEITI